MSLQGVDRDLINKFRSLIEERMGMTISHEKNYLLEAKLSKIASKIGTDNLKNLYEKILNGDEEAYNILIKHVTINHTFFFRENEHLDILCSDIHERKIFRPVIWCAAASTGEEVYSIIISLLENGIRDFVLVASDINRDVLNALNKGIYNFERLSHASRYILTKYFKKLDDGKYLIKRDLRSLFTIKKLNLIEPFIFEAKFDYIFCRNVLIYFENDIKKIVISNLLDNLKDDGLLFVGHTETLFNITDKVDAVYNSVYGKLINKRR